MQDIRIILHTSRGDIEGTIFASKVPMTAANFLNLAKGGFYNGIKFHRVIKDFMIQGGGFEPGMKQKKTRDPIKNEASNGLSNVRGTLAMARTNDPDSATAQFFINVKDNKFLDKNATSAGYAVFGKVTDGMDVVDKIRAVRTGTKGGHADVPTEDVVIKSMKIVGDKN